MLTRLEISVDRPAAYDGGPLVSRTWRPVDDPDSPLRRVPSSRFDTCATAPETRPLPAVKRAHPPGARNDDQLSSGVRPGRGAILRPVVLGPIGHCASPYPPPGRFAMFRVRHRRLCDRPQATMGSGIAHPLAPCRITNMIHTGRENANVLNCPAAVNHRRAKSRVSIETRELQLSTRECNFPGINNPTLK